MIKENIAFILFMLFSAIAIGIFTINMPTNYNGTDKNVQVQTNDSIKMSEFEYNGHTYIKFEQSGENHIVHSPDCKCLDDAKDIIDKMQYDYYD